MSYLDFYQLNQEPFSNVPVSRFYYNSTQHESAILRLTDAVDRIKGLALLVGDIGAGKTTLARRMLDSFPDSGYEASLLVIIHSEIDAHWLLRRIAQQLGIEEPSQTKLELLGQLYRRLVEIKESGKKAVVLIDEAQMLQTRDVMEELRGLLNLEHQQSKLLTLVLCGLPELEQNLRLDEPLAQRVAVRCRLGSLDEPAMEEYIKHRLRVAGAQRMVFSKEAVQAVFHYSRGVPRLINTICDNAMFEGHARKVHLVNQGIVNDVARDLGLGWHTGPSRGKKEGVDQSVESSLPSLSSVIHTDRPKVS